MVEEPEIRRFAIRFPSDVAAQAAERILVRGNLLIQRLQGQLPFTPPFPAVLVLEEEREEALALLKLPDGPATATRNPHLSLILTEQVTSLLPVGDQGDAIRKVVEAYADAFEGLHILITDPHSAPCPPVSESGVLHVRLYTSPAAQNTPRPLPAVFGHSLPPGVRDAVSFCGLGHPISAPEAIVGEAVSNNVYVHFDLAHASEAPVDRAALTAALLEAFLDQRMGRDPGVRFAHALKRRRAVRMIQLGERSNHAQARIDQLEAARALQVGLQSEAREALSALRDEGEMAVEDAEREFALVRSSPHVRAVSLEAGVLKVETDGEIHVQSPANTYVLGPYEISIPLYGTSSSIRITARNPKTLSPNQVVHHPHVMTADGAACFGGFAPRLTRFWEAHDWGMVVETCVSLLHAVNWQEDRARTLLTTCWAPSVLRRTCPCKRPEEEPLPLIEEAEKEVRTS